MIVTVEEVQKILSLHEIEMTDEKVEGLIEYYTNKIVGLTGISLEVNTFHYTIENKKNVKKIVLPLFNIFDVDEVHVNFKLMNDEHYFVDTRNGVIFFNPPIGFAEHIHIKYLTKLDDSIIDEIIKPLLIDMIMDGDDGGSTGGLGGDITSIHEGGVSIGLSNSTSLKSSIQNRLDKLMSGELAGTGKGGRKGVYYL